MISSVKGIRTILSEISPDDAQLIIDLRNNPEINKFLSSTEKISLEQQVAWITKNRLQRDNFYFKITDIEGRFYGTISLYNIRNGSAEFGRYIALNPIHAIEAEYLILRYGFEVRGLETIYCRTMLENKTVWNQHYKFGFIDKANIELNDKSDIKMKVQEIQKEIFEQFDYTPILKIISRF